MENPSQSIIVDFDVPAPMRDGLHVQATIYRPADAGRWPVLLTRTPYGRDVTDFSIQAARRGYVVIVQDTRGTYTSNSQHDLMPAEGDDGVDTIAWAAALPFSDGQVGMYGDSYVGFTQWAAAIKQPAALKTMVPGFTWADALDGFTYRGGAFELGHWFSANLFFGRGVLFRRHGHDAAELDRAMAAWSVEAEAMAATGFWSLPLAGFAPLRRLGLGAVFDDTVAAPMDRTPEPAASSTIAGHHDHVRASSLNIGGWYDAFLGGTLTNVVALRARGIPARLLIGPWTHARHCHVRRRARLWRRRGGRPGRPADALVRQLAQGAGHRRAGRGADPAVRDGRQHVAR